MNVIMGLYPFWDDLLTDTRFTDATLSVNRPTRVGNVFKTDAPWEGNNSDFFTLIREDGFYRMYYLGWDYPGTHGFHICYAESTDGIEWVKPSLGIVEFRGSAENNIIVGAECNLAGAYVMKDSNPDCPPEALYKMFGVRHDFTTGLATGCNLVVLYSADGIHFTEHHIFEAEERYVNMYDSLNTVWWDENDKKYYCYFRCTHPKPTAADPRYEESYARAIRVMTSEDCVHWTAGTPLDYLGGMDYQTYTNCISPYLYDNRYYIGFPTRYVERVEWNASFEHLTSKEWRKKRMNDSPRYGMTVTDCVFMSSRDKYHWFRFDEACLTPGPEDGYNWEYGDCYPAVGLIETPGRFSDEPELSLLCESHHWADRPVELIRYVFRRDGFASYKATFKPQTLRTKPFLFEGSIMKINFRTSARGSVLVKFLDEYNNPIEGYVSCEHFGDTTTRIVDFDRPLSALNGQVVRLEFVMSDAELYSMTFTD